MADKRYKPVKKFLREGFLADKEQYPRDVLVMKRFVADFIDKAASSLSWSQPAASRSCSRKIKRKTSPFVMRAATITKAAWTTARRSLSR